MRTEVPVAGGKSKYHYFIGPDNGVFSFVAPRRVRRGIWQIEDLSSLPPHLTAATFEGRGVFAPVAALILSGSAPESFGRCLERIGDSTSQIVEIVEPSVITLPNGIQGEILWFDSFGNAATNIIKSAVGEKNVSVFFDGRELPLFEHFAQMPADTLCAIWNSQGELELVCRESSAREGFRIERGMRVDLLNN